MERKRKTPTQDQRLEIHTLYTEVNTLCKRMFTAHPHTWSPPRPFLSLFSRSVWFRPSIYFPLLSLMLKIVSEVRGREASNKSLFSPWLSSFIITQRDERPLLVWHLDIRVSPCSYFFVLSALCRCVTYVFVYGRPKSAPNHPAGHLWYYQWCDVRVHSVFVATCCACCPGQVINKALCVYLMAF